MSPPVDTVTRLFVSDETAQDLRAEANYLSRTLGQPLVCTVGAAGILNNVAPSTVWVYASVDMDAFLGEVSDRRPCPEVMLPERATDLADGLWARGWKPAQLVHRLRRDAPQGESADRSARRSQVVMIRAAAPEDLPQMRVLHVHAFGTEDSADYLPDELLSVTGLQLFVAVPSAHPARLLGAVGVRLRHSGAFVFGLATALQHRRQGIADLLVNQCVCWAAGHGASFALADVDEPVSSLWPGLGFHTVSRWRRWVPAP